MATAILRLSEAREKLTTKAVQDKIDVAIECCLRKLEGYVK